MANSIPVCGRNDGFPGELDGITFSKWGGESVKGFGNAIVPKVAFEIFKVIQKLENNSANGRR
jgi:DNA (cytosine-5)-methyltransferase 1